jgi:RNase P subunit RPR2
MLGWGAKWLFSSETKTDFVTAKEAINRDDKRISKSLWKLVNEADAIISHNGNNFDIPKINTRFLLNGLQPPMPFISIDTRKIAYKQFGFSSNCLDYLGKIMLSKQKIHTDYQLWIDCENGNQDSLDFMENYCKADVGLLEEVYLELRPWIKSHPNLAVLMDAKEQCCPNCGSFEFEEGEGYYTTPQNKYVSVRCKHCGAVNRKKLSVISKEQREVMLIPNAR